MNILLISVTLLVLKLDKFNEIKIEVNKKDDKFQIVGFSIEPLSIKQKSSEKCQSFIINDGTLLRRDRLKMHRILRRRV